MAQIFDRSSNALARMSLVLSGLIVIALGVTLDQLQRSPWVTRQGQRAEQPIPFSHKHHVMGLGLQCQYCHTSVEKVELRRDSADQDMHQLPLADLDQCQSAGAGTRKLENGRVHSLDQGSRSARLRILQSRDSREQGPGLFDLSWTRRPDAADVSAEHAANGMVFELPSQSGQKSAADQRDL